MGTLYLGTSGYNYKHWKDTFYPKGVPQKDWLSFYSQRFNTVEINATFYRHFEKKVFEKWYNATDSAFRFAIKGPRLISHLKKLINVKEDLDRFLTSASGLKNKLLVVLWQFPGSFKNTSEAFNRLNDFLELLPKSEKFVFEFRHESWFDQAVYDLLNKYNAGFVINDTKAFPVKTVVTGKLAYIRFHGPGRLYASSYTDQQLREWAKDIVSYLRERDVLVYFNNDINGHALKNSATLKHYLGLAS